MRVKDFILLVLFLFVFSACNNEKQFSVSKYYNYDSELPLQDSLSLINETSEYKLYSLTFKSVHNKTVTGLLTIPENKKGKPLPVIILLHGMGDNKTVDYIEYGNEFMSKNGYAVLRIDVSNHGDRFENDYDIDLTGNYPFWARDVIIQTVFDLRRAVDFICTREELDYNHIGFLGISLGGITGTIFCGVEKRVKVSVIVLAGGQLNIMFGGKAFSSEIKDFLSVIEPLNFVEQISPRPLLMINAENDDVIPPIMSKLLYKKAKKPKQIIWYPGKHRTLPVVDVYDDALNWFNIYF